MRCLMVTMALPHKSVSDPHFIAALSNCIYIFVLGAQATLQDISNERNAALSGIEP